MYKYYLSKSLLILFFILHFFVNPSIMNANPQPWTQLEKGLKYTELKNPNNKNTPIYVLKFNPKFFQFNLYTIKENKHKALTLGQWAKQENLVSAINASMYLPDKITSTGYMRNNEHINNKHIAKNFGTFLVSKPYSKEDLSLPSTDILDKNTDNWKELIHKYEVVVQNFRLINSKRDILWNNNDSQFAISAIGKDSKGDILLIHSSYAITPYKFAQLLLQSPLDIRTVMYTEGGYQAGLLIDVPTLKNFWHGSTFVDFLMPTNIDAPIPNIIGVTRTKLAPE